MLTRDNLGDEFDYPTPTWPDPCLQEWMEMGEYGDRATDGCFVSEGKECRHGYPNWFTYLGYSKDEDAS